MIPLHPLPPSTHDCPSCRIPLVVRDWYMPGMRKLADLHCAQCGAEYFGDLPSGWGLYHPCLLDKRSGSVVSHSTWYTRWYVGWLEASYRNRDATSAPLGFEVESFRPLRRPVLLNVIDRLYGHSLSPLLGAQYYIDHRKDVDLVILVPRALRWMVPDGAAEVWTVDLPFARGAEWNDWLAARIRRQICDSPPLAREWWLSLGITFPHPSEFDISRFTGVAPFDPAGWQSGHCRPSVSFIWREDRTWPDPLSGGRTLRRGYQGLRRLARGAVDRWYARAQRRWVIRLAAAMRREFPGLDFAVIGFGKPGGMPSWITDLRATGMDAQRERDWCRRYAASHLVIGVHGSNLILPSAHAGSMIELVPTERWPMLGTTVAAPTTDVEEGICRYQFLPATTRPAVLAQIAGHLLRHQAFYRLDFSRAWTDRRRLAADPMAPRRQFDAISAWLDP